MKNGLNIILRVLIYLVIARHAINIPQQLIKMATGIYDNTICLATIGLSVSIIVLLYYVLKVKKWALISFFILQYINAFTIGVIEGNGEYLTHIIVSTIFCGLTSALLFLKKDGTSGWVIFFGRKNKENAATNDETLFNIQPINNSDTLPESAITDNTEKNIPNNPTEDKKGVDNEPQPNNIETIVASIPKKEDGSINYEAMDVYQQFEYTSITESKKVAIKDLNTEILIRKKEVKKLNHELSPMTGGKRAEQRDIIREKENEIQKMESLLPDSYKKQKSRRKNIIVSICTAIIIVIAVTFTIICKNYIDDQNIRLYRVSVFHLVSENKYIAPYDEFIDILDRPLRKYVIYSSLIYKYKVNLSPSYKEFASKLGYKDSNLAKELYDALKEKGVNIEKETNIDNFLVWLSKDDNFSVVSDILKRLEFHIDGLFEELGLTDKIRAQDNKTAFIEHINHEIKINSLLSANDNIRKDNITILCEAISENLEKIPDKKQFKEFLLKSKKNGIKIYNSLLNDYGVNLFDGHDDSESKFLNWLYQQ